MTGLRQLGTLSVVFMRLTWFLIGSLAGVGGSAWLMVRMSRARQALTPANLRRSAMLSTADWLEGAGTRLRSADGRG
jgi:hypothetical protein